MGGVVGAVILGLSLLLLVFLFYGFRLEPRPRPLRSYFLAELATFIVLCGLTMGSVLMVASSDLARPDLLGGEALILALAAVGAALLLRGFRRALARSLVPAETAPQPGGRGN